MLFTAVRVALIKFEFGRGGGGGRRRIVKAAVGAHAPNAQILGVSDSDTRAGRGPTEVPNHDPN